MINPEESERLDSRLDELYKRNPASRNEIRNLFFKLYSSFTDYDITNDLIGYSEKLPGDITGFRAYLAKFEELADIVCSHVNTFYREEQEWTTNGIAAVIYYAPERIEDYFKLIRYGRGDKWRISNLADSVRVIMLNDPILFDKFFELNKKMCESKNTDNFFDKIHETCGKIDEVAKDNDETSLRRFLENELKKY